MALFWSTGGAVLLVCLYVTRTDAGPIVAQPSVVSNQTSAVLNCTITVGSAILRHHWTKNGKVIESTKEESSATTIHYKLKKIDSHSGGEYACVFHTEGGDVSETILVKTVPHVGAYKHSEHANEGEKGVLVCVSHGYPLPTDWTWSMLGPDNTEQAIVNGTGKYEIKSTPNRTTLFIHDLEMEKDVGDYKCLGQNELGVADDKIHLRVRSRLAALWPFLGIVVEVIILVSIIFIYEKRRKPDEIIDDDDSGAAPLKNDSTNHKEDQTVRQRNSN